RNGTSIWPVMCNIGVPAVSASTIAPQALPAAVPVLVNATPSPPRTRAYASAMLTAPASPRAGTQRMTPRRMIASSIGMLWMLITPKAARTPAASRNAATTSPAMVCSGTAETAGKFDDRTGHVAAHGRGEKGDRRRDFLGAP